MERRAELAANLEEVRERVARACLSAGREPAEVTLVAVTKTWPATDVALLAELGVTDVGENRDQEASAKHDEVEALLGGSDRLRWHFIGQLQRNKARSVARYADVVESVDRPALATALAAARPESAGPLEVLLQVSLDGAVGRGGALPEDLPALAASVAEQPALELRGLMAVAPLDQDPDAAFARLHELSAALRVLHPAATALSAGMSGDMEAAIRNGATHVRVGTAVLGHRGAIG